MDSPTSTCVDPGLRGRRQPPPSRWKVGSAAEGERRLAIKGVISEICGRVSLIVCLLLLPSMLLGADQQSCERVRVGAIRWDAWHGDDSVPGRAVERSLGHARWVDRWPDFTEFHDDGIEFDGARREVVDREMGLARNAGIDFWAFVYYGTGSPMGRVLRQFLDSEVDGPSFAFIIEFGRLVGNQAEELAAGARAAMRDRRYLRDEDGRPVVFVWLPAGPTSTATIDSGIERLRISGDDAVQPSFVVMSFAVKEAARVAKWIGADRISTYAWHDNPRGAPYASLVRGVEQLWERQAETGSRVVPLVMSGWDPRPRILNPVPWGGPYPEGAHYESATPDELTSHMRSALRRARHPTHGACAVLIYAWNEFDEGGWIAPTRGAGHTRLQAIARAIRTAE